MNRLYNPDAYKVSPVRRRLIKNSEVIKVQDLITDEATGAANVDGVTEPILGLVTDIVNKDGISLLSPASPKTYKGTLAASTKQYTAASDNETVDLIAVEYIPVREGDRFIMTLDDEKGKTTGSNKEGYYIAVSTGNSALLDESTAATSKSNTQARIVDPYLSGPVNEVIVEFILRQENS